MGASCRPWLSCSTPGRTRWASSPSRCRRVSGVGADAPSRMQRPSDRWVSITLSVLLHAALLGGLAYGWLLFRRPPRPAPTLAIEAHVVDARSVRGLVQPAPQPAPPPPAPPESVGPPQPTPEELSEREQRQQEEAAVAEQQRAAAEKAAAEAA